MCRVGTLSKGLLQKRGLTFRILKKGKQSFPLVYIVKTTLGKGEKMPKQIMFIIFIAVIILAGFLAYTQVQMLR
jgi:hypothetical protein